MLKVFKFLKPFTPYIALIFLFVLVQTFTELALPYFMANIVEKGILISDVNQNSDIPYILNTGAIMLIVALLGGVAVIFVSYFSAKVSSGMGQNIRNKVFEKVMNFPQSQVDSFGAASLITRTTNDVLQVQNITVFTLRMILGAPFMAVGGVIMALRQDKSLTFIFLIAIPILALVIFIIAKHAIPLFKIMQKKLDKLNLILRERLTGIRVIRAYDKEVSESKRFDFANKDLTDTAVKVNRLMASLMPFLMLIMNFTTIAIVWFSAHRIDAGTSNIGTMMAFIQYAMLILISLIMFAVIFVMLPRAIASAERINEVLDCPSNIFNEIEKPTNAYMKGHLEFKNVTFSYDNASEPVLDNLSFEANPGEVTAIIGSTGSGKSTVVNLILRFYEIESGNILIDGVNIKNLSVESLRSRIGLVPQKAVLFSGTIEENLRYGNENARHEDFEDALRISQASEFVNTKDGGLDKVLIQGGLNLSGGQRQRLSIARAIVRKPEIYIFDDSFSALDFKTEYELRKELKNSLENETVIIVAQRISTIVDADQIIVLNEGKIAGRGKHKELLKTNTIYQEIVNSQAFEEGANGR